MEQHDGRHAVTRAALLIAVALVLLAGTAGRVRLWQDETALWAEAVRLAPAKPRPLMNWANQVVRRGDPDAAEAAYRAVVALAAQPGRSVLEQQTAHWVAEANLAILDTARGRRPLAIHRLQRLVARYPDLMAARQLQAQVDRAE